MNSIEQFKIDHPEILLDNIFFQNGTAEITFTNSQEVFDITSFVRGSKTRILLEELISKLRCNHFGFQFSESEMLKCKSLQWIVEQFSPNSKYGNAVYHCACWLLDCGNFDTRFIAINDTEIIFQNQETMKEYIIRYSFDENCWKWEFSYSECFF